MDQEELTPIEVPDDMIDDPNDPSASTGAGAGTDASTDADVRPMALPTNIISETAVLEELDRLGSVAAREMDPGELTARLLARINSAIVAENARDKTHNRPQIKRSPIEKLDFHCIALVLRRLFHVINLSPSAGNTDPDMDLLAIYDDDPASANYGTYQTSLRVLRRMARAYCRNLTTNDFDQLIADLQDHAPRRTRGSDRDLIAVKNGIFNYSTKQLMNFDPEQIFLSKVAVNYRADAENPVITHPEDGTVWDIESWMGTLSDDPEVVELLWEIIGAIVRPYVSWNRSAWFYSEQGNNGKGTLVELMRNICGPQSYASIALTDFSKDFMLEPLTRANAILVDENDVGTFIDRAANLKAIITNDVISINRKFKAPIAYQFYGFMVQCLNEFPKIRDKSESFYRRQLFVPFTQCFTGAERRYIKDDYIQRTDVLEYALKRVLHMDYYELSTPDAVVSVLDEYKEFNDPIRAFWNEFQHQFVWDMLPTNFLYDLYKAWLEKTMPSSKPQGRNTFVKDLVTLVNANSNNWECPDPTAYIRPASRMSGAEPLIAEYALEEWYNPKVRNTRSANAATLSQPALKQSYRALTRKQPTLGAIDPAKVNAARKTKGIEDGDPVTSDFSEIRAEDKPETPKN